MKTGEDYILNLNLNVLKISQINVVPFVAKTDALLKEITTLFTKIKIFV
jgi:hypothetical protein